MKFSQTNEPPQNELCELFFKYGSDKCPQIFHTYSPEYYETLKDFKDTFSDIIEIGVGSNEVMKPIVGDKYVVGSSLLAWRDFFQNAYIYGLDINQKVLFDDERIKCFFTDQSSRSELQKTISEIRNFRNDQNLMFDLILDDGSHIVPHMLLSFEILFEYVKPNGYYIIEDIKKHELDIFTGLEIKGGEIVKVHEGSGVWDAFMIIKKNG